MANLTPHINAEKNDLAKTVLMPGDPKRAELIAKKYFENARLITDVRGILGYTGTYNGKEMSCMASGMGMPSMGIYSYELFNVFDVENIIRIGSCGSYDSDLDLLDLILVDNAYTEGNYALSTNNEDVHIVQASEFLNKRIEEVAQKIHKRYIKGTISCSEAFYTIDESQFWKRVPEGVDLLAVEMEAFSLFYNAKLLHKNAACILTVTDIVGSSKKLTAEQREKSLDNMIALALETACEL